MSFMDSISSWWTSIKNIWHTSMETFSHQAESIEYTSILGIATGFLGMVFSFGWGVPIVASSLIMLGLTKIIRKIYALPEPQETLTTAKLLNELDAYKKIIENDNEFEMHKENINNQFAEQSALLHQEKLDEIFAELPQLVEKLGEHYIRKQINLNHLRYTNVKELAKDLSKLILDTLPAEKIEEHLKNIKYVDSPESYQEFFSKEIEKVIKKHHDRVNSDSKPEQSTNLGNNENTLFVGVSARTNDSETTNNIQQNVA